MIGDNEAMRENSGAKVLCQHGLMADGCCCIVSLCEPWHLQPLVFPLRCGLLGPRRELSIDMEGGGCQAQTNPCDNCDPPGLTGPLCLPDCTHGLRCRSARKKGGLLVLAWDSPK